MGSLNSGSASRNRAPSTASSCAWTSHTITYPVHPLTSITNSSTSPLTHASARGPQLRPCANIRNACTTMATTAASDAYRCRVRIHRPSHTWSVIRATDSYGAPIR